MILIVDDDSAVRSSLSFMLKRVPSRRTRYTDDGMGKHPTCRTGYAGGRFRLYYQAVEQCRSFAAYRNRFGIERRSEGRAGGAGGRFEP